MALSAFLWFSKIVRKRETDQAILHTSSWNVFAKFYKPFRQSWYVFTSISYKLK